MIVTCPECGSSDVRVGTRGVRYCADCFNQDTFTERDLTMLTTPTPSATGPNAKVILKRLGGYFGPERMATFEVIETTNTVRPLVREKLDERQVQELINRGINVTIKRK